MPAITKNEVVELFRKALRGEVAAKCADPERKWGEIFAGNAEFWFGDWKIVFFNDCNSLDYTDHVIAPDGREADFDDWNDGEFCNCPLSLLSGDELGRFERLLEKAN